MVYIIQNLDVVNFLGTLFVDRFVRRIFPVKRQDIMWHCHLIAKLDLKKLHIEW